MLARRIASSGFSRVVGAALVAQLLLTIHTNSDSTLALTAARGPNQRSTFYAAGRYWVFYADFDAATGPFDLYYTSYGTGWAWSDPTLLTTIPLYGIHFDVRFDGTYVHILKVMTTNETSVHQGLMYRRGVPNSDGTITWDHNWQTILSADYRAGDPIMVVDTAGHAWVGYQGGDGAGGEATIIKNAATDGSWSTAAGFPVELTSLSQQWHAVPSPLQGGGMHVIAYRYGTDDYIKGFYSSDGSSTFTSEGNISTALVEANSQSGASVNVACVTAASLDGVVHIAYQANDRRIVYLRRATNGAYDSEVQITASSVDELSTPRVSFGAGGEIVLLWSYNASSVMGAMYDGSWNSPQVMFSDSLQDHFEHLMPAETAPNDLLPLVYLTSTYAIKFRQLDVNGMAD